VARIDLDGTGEVGERPSRSSSRLTSPRAGAFIFSVPDVTKVLAIDSLGRVLALRGRELVAIA
jgi:hypothetical protein